MPVNFQLKIKDIGSEICHEILSQNLQIFVEKCVERRKMPLLRWQLCEVNGDVLGPRIQEFCLFHISIKGGSNSDNLQQNYSRCEIFHRTSYTSSEDNPSIVYD